MQYDGLLPTQISFAGTSTGTVTLTLQTTGLPSQLQLSSGADVVTTAMGWDRDREQSSVDNFVLSRTGADRLPANMGDGIGQKVYGFNPSSQLIDSGLTVATTVVSQVNLQRDVMGRVVQRTETAAGVQSVRKFTYDQDGQLTAVTNPAAASLEQYAYDVNGNLISKTLAGVQTNIAYDSMDRITNAAGLTYSYDERGFLSSRGNDQFVYDTEGRLLNATIGGNTITYTYDALKRRTSRLDAGGKIEYFYANPNSIMQVTHVREADGVLSTLYYDPAGILIAFDRGSSAAAVRYYVSTDNVGSPTVIANAAGLIVKQVSYSAFGEVLSETNPAFSSVLGFAGGLPDQVTGLVRFTYRDFEPATGHWTGRDPVLFSAGQANIYIYAQNDPINFRDPSGLYCVGASGYYGFGGGGKVCADEKGWSLCVEAGVGLGSSLGSETSGGGDSISLSGGASVSGGVGGIDGTVTRGFDLDKMESVYESSNGISFGNLGVKAKRDLKTGCFSNDASLDFGNAIEGAIFSFQLKANAEVCTRL